MINDKDVFALLEQFGEELIADIDKSLQNKGFGSKANGGTQSTGLIGSTTFDINTGGGGLTMSFYMNDYWYYVQYGRGKTQVGKSKKPFEKTLAGKLYASGWDVGKGINAREWYKKRLKDPSKSKMLKDYEGMRKLLTKAIAHNIHKKGTIKRFGYKGSNFLTDVFQDGRFDSLSEKLSELIGQKIVIDITNQFKQ